MHGLDFPAEVSQLGPRFEQPLGAGSTRVVVGVCSSALPTEADALPQL